MEKRTDVTDLAKMLTTCKVLPITLVDAILAGRGKSPFQVQAIKNQLMRRYCAYIDPSNIYMFSSRSVQANAMNLGQIKGLWLALALSEDIQSFYLQCNAPLVLTFVGKKNSGDDNPCYHVFYIRHGDENAAIFCIKSIFNDKLVKKTFVIVDDPEQIDKISLPKDRFDIYCYAVVDAKGKVDFYKPNEEDDSL